MQSIESILDSGIQFKFGYSKVGYNLNKHLSARWLVDMGLRGVASSPSPCRTSLSLASRRPSLSRRSSASVLCSSLSRTPPTPFRKFLRFFSHCWIPGTLLLENITYSNLTFLFLLIKDK